MSSTFQEHHVTNSHSKVLNLELNLTSVESQTRVSIMHACSYTTKELYSVLMGLDKAINYTKTCLEAILVSSGKDSMWYPNRVIAYLLKIICTHF